MILSQKDAQSSAYSSITQPSHQMEADQLSPDSYGAWWHTPAITMLWGLMQGGHEVKASMGYKAGPSLKKT